MSLNKDKKALEDELSRLRNEVKELMQKSEKPEVVQMDSELSALVKYMTEERERTNRMLTSIMDRIGKMEQRITSVPIEVQGSMQEQPRAEFPLGRMDLTIVEMAQAKGMICADDVKDLFQYRGRNGASARLNNLRRMGLLKRHQIGHRAYYSLDADKATKIQIISPPQ
ncbi:MAG: hypothetical protein KGH72_03185 [Candidatus Micrarchaeota archaeon]|nr:hypothetical protein [Candidatus Micrarchaeota archaeon]